MRDFCELAIDTAQKRGATYADIRIIHTDSESISAKNEQVSGLWRDDDIGFGVRVIANGSWGFAASSRLDREEIQRVAAEAVEIALASSRTKIEDVILADEPVYEDVWRTPIEVNPFDVPIEEKIDLLLRVNAIGRKKPEIKVASSAMSFIREHQFFANTEGSFIEQEIFFSGAGYDFVAIGDGEIQRRSFPNSFGRQHMTKGYELIGELNLLENAERIADEAVMLLTARKCPEMETDLIIDGSQLALQIHESVGHPLELDRVLGSEANYAGTSFVTVDKMGKLKYGSDIVNIVADSTIPHGLATVGYDDEGVKAQRWHLIENGVFVGYLTSRETAHVIGETRSRGCMRADGWRRIPLIRMTNISLMPGSGTLDELINDTADGIYLETNKSWSIDQKRVNFQFATEIGWRIKNGKITEPLKDCSYQGITVDFWNACDAICGEEEFILWGVNNCGKGQPGQRAQMSHGASPSRFRKIKVGIA